MRAFWIFMMKIWKNEVSRNFKLIFLNSDSFFIMSNGYVRTDDFPDWGKSISRKAPPDSGLIIGSGFRARNQVKFIFSLLFLNCTS